MSAPHSDTAIVPSDPYVSDLVTRCAITGDTHTLAGADAHVLSAVLGRVVDTIRAGARSAATYPGDGLTYADGWRAASTLAALESARALGAELAPD